MEIEFLDPDPDEFPVGDEARDPQPGDRRTVALRLVRDYAPPVLWVAAAALATVAPFRIIDTITVRQQGQIQGESTDGWGRYRSLGGGSALAHGPRYGAVLLGCAAVLAPAAAVALLRALGHAPGPVLRRLRTILGIAGASGLAALIAVLVLNYLSTKDTLTAQVKSFGSSTPGTLVSEVITAHVRFGGCMWLAVAALGCALLGIVADLLAARADRPAPVPIGDFAPVPDHPAHPQDDLLESGPAA